ncbi:unnamed protein product [Tilletia controversa]|uniref:Uncharacterized protein n=3 Tax=Tilletia TaxID=13289 RepID=A0A8X7MVB0_9BASI|nr:hypothetical protein CF336_g7634 [Tilletia laevis]KAE8200555.1 hypothetical protein CF328_g2934 [Tilletia controversa]KAE8248000.1 hypothetical protein A4X03_0g6900 [Tilletia caries]KAE8205446.1 hypothetical protein CF335_g2299 [Tilletia laevis]KAE8248436.1 hypothetical protein A4X06_0g3716 [Tilletia controversa]
MISAVWSKLFLVPLLACAAVASPASTQLRAEDDETFKDICNTSGFHCVNIQQDSSWSSGPYYHLSGPSAYDTWSTGDGITYLYKDGVKVLMEFRNATLTIHLGEYRSTLKLGGLPGGGPIKARFDTGTNAVSESTPFIVSPAGPHTVWVNAVV